MLLESGIHFEKNNIKNSLQSKLTNKTESCNVENGEWAPNERYREATSSTAPTSVSGGGGKRRAKVSKRTRSVPNITGSNSGKMF